MEQWARTAERLRFLDPEVDLDDLFLFKAVRKVQKDRTVSLDGRAYEVEAALIGENVTLRYDPHTVERTLQVWHDGKFIAPAKPVDLYARRSRLPASRDISTSLYVIASSNATEPPPSSPPSSPRPSRPRRACSSTVNPVLEER
ncbi:Mu transposase C-terminal domain-containing protein [Endothiovibrio diazotrophicus]